MNYPIGPDVRFAGKRGRYEYRPIAGLANPPTNGTIIPASGDRVALVLYAAWTVPAIGQNWGLRTDVATTAPVIAAVTNERPTLIVTYAQLGDALLRPLYVTERIAPEIATLAEVVWIPEE